MRTLHWAESGSPEPRAPKVRPVRHLRADTDLLPHGRPGQHRMSPPALAAIVDRDDSAARAISATNPQAEGVP